MISQKLKQENINIQFQKYEKEILMKILFIIGSMSSGGAERVISIISNYWVSKGWDVTILTTNVTSKKRDFYLLDNRIKRKDISNLISLNSKIKYFFDMLINIRNVIKKENPDVVISFISGLNIITIIAMMGLNIPIIISDRSNPYRDKIKFIYKFLLYPFSKKLVLQTNGVKKFYKNIPNLDIEIIPNPISKYQRINKNKRFVFEKKTICAVGRLNNSLKGFDLLIKAFKIIENQYKDWQLIIFGEGKDRDNLENLIQELKLDKRVILAGRVENPREIIVDADIFVLSSLEEGFPNVLLEAMSVGLPCVSFDCDYGPREIIDDRKNGILVEPKNIKALSDALVKLIKDKSLREKLGKNAKEKVSREFNIYKVMSHWENMIKKVIS